MKLECSRDKLKEAVSLAERITGKNLSLPVLSKVFLSATERHLTVRSTNLDLGLEWKLPAKVDKPGAVSVSGAVLVNLLTNLDGQERLKLELVGENLSLITSQHTTLVKAYPADDFPTLPVILDGVKISINGTNLVSGLRVVAYAAALNDI